MQAGGGGGDRAVLAGVDGLVVGAVAGVLGPPRGDVGRQGHRAEGAHRLVQRRPREIEGQPHLAGLVLGFHRGVQARQQEGPVPRLPEAHPVGRLQPLARTHEGRPSRRPQPLVQRGLHPHRVSVALAQAEQARRDHPGVVEHQGVAGGEQVRQLGDDAVIKAAVGTDDEQARGIPRTRRAERDAVLGKVEVEIGKAQVRGHPAAKRTVGGGASRPPPLDARGGCGDPAAMTTPINLNKARKARARAADKAQAAENRAKFGRTKVEKAREKARASVAKALLDGAKRDR